MSSTGGFYDGPATSACPSGTSTIDIDFDKGKDDFGESKGTLRFTGKQGFVVYFTDDDSNGRSNADGVEITNQQYGNCHKAGNCNAGQASQSGGFVLGANNDPGDNFQVNDYHTSGIVAVFNQGATKVSFMDTDDDSTVKAVFAYDKDGNFIGQSEKKSRQAVSIDTSQTKDNALIYSLEFDTEQGTSGGSNDGTVFTIDNFHAEGVCADTQIGTNPLMPCKTDCPENTFVSGCSGSNPGTCEKCDPKNCPDGFYLTGCGGFGAGTCISDPAVATSDPDAKEAAEKQCSASSVKNSLPSIGSHTGLETIWKTSPIVCSANVSTPFKIENGILGLTSQLEFGSCGYNLRIAATGAISRRSGQILDILEDGEKAQDCDDHWTESARSGVYTINPGGTGAFSVWCDFASDDVPWTVFQHRTPSTSDVNFYRTFSEYQAGFGSPAVSSGPGYQKNAKDAAGSYWLGLDNLYRLVSMSTLKLRIDMCDGGDPTVDSADCRTALYSTFSIGNSADKYRLNAGGYSHGVFRYESGKETSYSPGDSLTYHSGNTFSTHDQDNDHWSAHCAQSFHGAWWYHSCHYSNLNGGYGKTDYANGLSWYHWVGYYNPVEYTKMAVRRKTAPQKKPDKRSCPASHPIPKGDVCLSKEIRYNFRVVSRVDNSRPRIPQGQVRKVSEAALPGSNVGLSLTCEDDEANMHSQSITWTLEACIPFSLSKCPLRVDGCTGIIAVTDLNENLDFESLNATAFGPKVVLTLVATDDGTPAAKSLPQNVTVIIEDANDPPTISSQMFNVAESAPLDNVVGMIKAHDPDGDTYLTFTDLTTLPNPFHVELDTGAIKVSSLLNYEGSMQSVSLRVSVMDSTGTSSRDTALIKIEIEDSNDAPMIQTDEVLLPESCAPDSSDSFCRVQIAGYDEDDDNEPPTGFGSPLSWSLNRVDWNAGGCGDALEINSSTGVLAVNSSSPAVPLDFEMHPNGCKLQIHLTDSKGLMTSRSVNVRILDVNEPPELQLTECANPFVNENSAIGINVTSCSLAIRDPDNLTVPVQEITALQSAGAATGLKVVLTTLNNIYITVSKEIDFETNPNIIVSIFMRDDGTPMATQQADLIITVIDVNEPPEFQNVISLRSVPENSAAGTHVTGAPLIASDPDAGQTASLKYSVRSQSGKQNFAINESNGYIRVGGNATLNFEVQPLVKIWAQVMDSGNISVEALVDIVVTDENDPPRLNMGCCGSNISTKIPLNLENGSRVGAPFTASDEDNEHGEFLTFHKDVGQDWKNFVLDEKTGQIRLANKYALEDGQRFFLRLRAVDPEGAYSDWGTLVVEVLDGISIPRFMDGQIYSIGENSGGFSGSIVSSDLKCSDPDAGETLSFSIVGVISQTALNYDLTSFTHHYGEVGPFVVDSSGDGRLIVQNPGLNYEKESAYNLTITCTDTIGSQDSTIIQIQVVDEPDAPQVVDEGGISLSVGENMAPGSVIGTIQVMDEDVYDLSPLPDGQLTFEVASTGIPSSFNVSKFGARIHGTNMFAVNISVASIAPGSQTTNADVAATSYPTLSCQYQNIFDFGVDDEDFGRLKGVLRYSAADGFVVYFSSRNNWPSKPYSHGVAIVDLQNRNSGKVLASKSTYSSVLAVFNQGAKSASFFVTEEDTCVLKKVYAYNKYGEYIGESEESCSREISLNTTQTKQNSLIYALELDTVSASMLAFSVDRFVVRGTCADSQILSNPLAPCKLNCPDNTYVSGCVAERGGTCKQCSPSICKAGTFLRGCGIFGNGTCVRSPLLSDSDPKAIKFQPFLNYEVQSEYSLRVEVTDSTSNTLEFDATIHVTNENDAPSFDTDQTFSWNVPESVPTMTKIGTITAIDEDVKDQLIFSIASNEKVPFIISSEDANDRSAHLYTEDLLDYEKKTTYTLMVFVVDQKGGEASAPFTVNVLDVDDVFIQDVVINTKDGKLSSSGGDFVTFYGQNFGQLPGSGNWLAGSPILHSLSSRDGGILLPSGLEPNPFHFGRGAFTVETWIWPNGTLSSHDQWITGTQGSDQVGYVALVADKNSTSSWYCTVGSEGVESGLKIYGAILLQNQWNHLACVRAIDGTLTTYTNGRNSSTTKIVQDLGPGSIPSVGADPSMNKTTFDYFRGQVRSVRFTKGLALYMNLFVPEIIHSCHGLSRSTAEISCFILSNATSLDLSDLSYSVTYGGDNADAFWAKDCVRLLGNTILRCRSAEGYGENLRWKISIAGAASGSSIASVLTSYRRPMLQGIKSVNSIDIDSTDPVVISSRGNEKIVMYGDNLGSLGLNLTAEYGRNGLYYCGKCEVTKAHSEVTCFTVAGTGVGLAWRLMGRGPNSNNIWSSSISAFSVDYSRPEISVAVTPLTNNGLLSTRGDDEVRLVGHGFGPATNARYATCSGLSGAEQNLLDGSNAASAGANDGIRFVYGENPVYVGNLCRVLSDNVTVCSTPAGTGANHALKLTISGQESPASYFRLSYEPPIIYSVSGPGAFGGTTRGGMKILVQGSNFGPGQQDLNIRLTYGSIFQVDCEYLSQVAVECMSSEGFGNNFDYIITVDGQVSNVGAFNGSYAAPSINNVKKADALQILMTNSQTFGSARLLGIGSETVIIEGSNFGPDTPVNEITASYSNGDSIFDAVKCKILVPHTQISCLSAPGAGINHVWSIKVGGQDSEIPTTSYLPPIVTSVTRYLADSPTMTFDELHENFTTRGGEIIEIQGENFGPASKSSDLLKWVKYGPSGELYDAENCTVLSDNKITCLTIPGSGKNLAFRINILGQSSELNLSPNATISYAPPSIFSIRRSSLSPNSQRSCELSNEFQNSPLGSGVSLNCTEAVFSDASIEDPTLRLVIRAQHSGFGAEDGTIIFAKFGDKRIPIDESTSTRNADGYESLAFEVPELSGNDASAQIPVYIISSGVSGRKKNSRNSNQLLWSYAIPVIQQLHLQGTSTSGQFILTVVGFNFGLSPGDIILVSGDGDLDGDGVRHDACTTCVISQGNPELASYIEDWSHRQIRIRYMGSYGTIQVKSGGGQQGGSILSHMRLSSNLLSFNTSSPNVVDLIYPSSAGVWNGYDTRGGQSLIVIAENAYGDASKLQILIGDSESGTMYPQQDNNCRITSVVYPVEGGKDRSRISCTVPKGQGGNQRVVVVREGVLRSLASTDFEIAYARPTLSGLLPADTNTDFQLSEDLSGDAVAHSKYLIETRGQWIVARGSNFGGDNDSAVVYMDGIATQTLSRSQDNNLISFWAPCGSGLKPRALWVSVAGQNTCDLTSDVLTHSENQSTVSPCMQHSIAYRKPILDGIVVPPPESITTEGGFEIQLKGRNFIAEDCFEPQAEPMVVVVGESNCKIINSTYSSAWCVIDEGVGRDQQISVSVDGQEAPIPNTPDAITGGSNSIVSPESDRVGDVAELFKYPPPYITHVQPASDLPTDGGLNMSIFGGNFGSRRSTSRLRIYFLQPDSLNGKEDSENNSIIIDMQKNPDAFHSIDHKLIVVSSPVGEGVGLRMIVEVGGPTGDLQNSTDTILVSFASPVIESVSVSQWPTSGCIDGSLEDIQAWSSRLDGVSPLDLERDPLRYARRCNSWLMIEIHGSNFGRPNGMLKVWAEPTSSTSSSPQFPLWPPRNTYMDACMSKASRAHDRLFVCSPVGYGADVSLKVSVAGQIATLKGLGYMEPEVRSSFPNPYKGGSLEAFTSNSKSSQLVEFRGINFGAINSSVEIFLDGKQCNSAVWKAVSEEDGLPYVECEAPQDVVGPKNLTLKVAGQKSRPIPLIRDFTRSVVRSVCGEGPQKKSGRPDIYWGRVGELCSPCPNPGGLCEPGTYKAPAALPGFFMRHLDISYNSDSSDGKISGPLSVREKADKERALETIEDSTISQTTKPKRRCPAERYFDPSLDKDLISAFPGALKWRRDLCEEVVPCKPKEACLGENKCGPEYLYLRKQCLASSNRSLNENGLRIGHACNVSLQCQAVSQGQDCFDAIADICACPADWEIGSYSCLKSCVQKRGNDLQAAGCSDILNLEHRLAGGECSTEHPENCQKCVARVDPSSLQTRGMCACNSGAQRCGLCTSGEYYRLNDACVECPRNVSMMIALFFIAIFVCCLVCYILDQRGFNMALVSIGVDYFQIMGLLAATDIKWPALLMTLFRAMSFFNVNIDIVGPECIVPNLTFEQKFYGTVFFPLIIFICLSIAGVGISITSRLCPCMLSGKQSQNKGKHVLSKLIGTFFLVIYFAYLMVTRRALDVFNCNPTEPSDGYLYASFTSLECPGGLCRCYYPGHVQARLVLPAAFAALMYGVGFPIFVLYVIRKNKTKIKLDQILRALGTGDDEETNPEAIHTRRRYRMMYYHFKPGKIYWIVYILARKLGIATAGLLFRANPGFQMASILLVMFVAYVWQVKHQPYMSSSQRKEAVAEHQAKASAGNRLHVRIAKWVQRTERRMSMNKHSSAHRNIQNFDRLTEISSISAKKTRTNPKTREYFWDFNTVEQVLISCSIFVCLAGVMFESDRFSANSAFSWQREVLSYLTIMCLMFSIFYYAVVMASEISGCIPMWLKRALASKEKLSHLHKESNGGIGDSEIEMMSVSTLVLGNNGSKQNLSDFTVNPMKIDGKESTIKDLKNKLNKLEEINRLLVEENRTFRQVDTNQKLKISKKYPQIIEKAKKTFGQQKMTDVQVHQRDRYESLNPLNGGN